MSLNKWMKKQKALDAEMFSLNFDSEYVDLAKKLAHHYRNKCKAMNVFLEPFSPNVPIELQSTFTNFLKAAKICAELEASPRAYISSQFAGLAFTKKPPYSAQLATPRARERYLTYSIGKVSREDKKVKESDNMHEAFALEKRKAERMAAQLGVSTRRAIKIMRNEFSPSFLEHMEIE